MKRDNRKKTEQIHICYICGKEIASDEDYDYVKTRRGTEIYLHKKCVGGMSNGRN